MVSSSSEDLLQAILKVIRCWILLRNRRLLLLITLSPMMSARSLNDLAETCLIVNSILYAIFDSRQPASWFPAIRREGTMRLVSHLLRLTNADSYASMGCVTLCADDSTLTVCGNFGELPHPCYSGAEKQAVKGLRTRALIAVIGECAKQIVLDVHVVLPKRSRRRSRYTEDERLVASLNRVEFELNQYELSIRGCYLSVGSSYAVSYVPSYAEENGFKLVSEVKVSLKVIWHNILLLPADLYFFAVETIYLKEFKTLFGKPEIQYYRHKTQTRVYGEVLIVLMHGNRNEALFPNDDSMKSITVRRVARRRGQLELVFWNLKQLLGLPRIHNQSRNRVMVRVYLWFIPVQAIKNCSWRLNLTMRRFHTILERNPFCVLEQINCWCASVVNDSANESSIQELAA